jgi:hypothetical protein
MAKNSSIISAVLPIVFTLYRNSISDSRTLGPMNTPVPCCPNAFISALSSNSPTTLGRRSFAWHHRSKRDFTAVSTPGKQHRRVSQAAGKLSLEALDELGG